MAKTLGSSGKISADVGAGDDLLAYVKNASFSIAVDEVESTDNDSSNQWKDFLMGNRSGTFSFTCNAGALVDIAASEDDLEQSTLVEYLVHATNYTTLVAWTYQPHGTTTDYRKYTFNGYIQEISHDMSNNEVVELSFTIRISGAVVATNNT
jgi:hypothetical protein